MAESTDAKPSRADANSKETVESILVAFILAFIFRAFVVEAFVIPTGSMAPTLYGAHARYKCQDCGFVFDGGVNGKRSASGDDIDFESNAVPAIDFHCPNCGYPMTTETQPVRYGDRILVLKYLYLFQKPVPGDVVVFKSPAEHDGVDAEYGVNYIKRLIGVGPESVVILDGDVYTGPYDAEQPLGPDNKPLFKIQRKPEYVQNALWRVVCDTDFIPHLGVNLHSWTQPWRQENEKTGWVTTGPRTRDWPDNSPSRTFSFSNPAGAGALSFDSGANPDTHALTDFLVYDEAQHRDNDSRSKWDPVFVSDLKLTCDYIRSSGEGPLRLQLSKNADLFTAEFTPGKVRLLKAQRVSPDRPEFVRETVLGSKNLSELSVPATARVEIRNVDYRVSVRVNGTEVLATTDDNYMPKIAELWKQEEATIEQRELVQGPFARPLVRIEAQQQDCRIEHVVLSRDVHYLSYRRGNNFWGTVHRISHLKAGEYFVMGDNTFISGDARYWDAPVNLPHEGLETESGRVPERFMLGKAFFVYWPAGYKLPYVPLNAVPDFGEMRFIH